MTLFRKILSRAIVRDTDEASLRGAINVAAAANLDEPGARQTTVSRQSVQVRTASRRRSGEEQSDQGEGS
jgi:hypothetical protein